MRDDSYIALTYILHKLLAIKSIIILVINRVHDIFLHTMFLSTNIIFKNVPPTSHL